jgi:hypothetical protein
MNWPRYSGAFRRHQAGCAQTRVRAFSGRVSRRVKLNGGTSVNTATCDLLRVSRPPTGRGRCGKVEQHRRRLDLRVRSEGVLLRMRSRRSWCGRATRSDAAAATSSSNQNPNAKSRQPGAQLGRRGGSEQMLSRTSAATPIAIAARIKPIPTAVAIGKKSGGLAPSFGVTGEARALVNDRPVLYAATDVPVTSRLCCEPFGRSYLDFDAAATCCPPGCPLAHLSRSVRTS